jgi:hypothetical protein
VNSKFVVVSKNTAIETFFLAVLPPKRVTNPGSLANYSALIPELSLWNYLKLIVVAGDASNRFIAFLKVIFCGYARTGSCLEWWRVTLESLGSQQFPAGGAANLSQVAVAGETAVEVPEESDAAGSAEKDREGAKEKVKNEEKGPDVFPFPPRIGKLLAEIKAGEFLSVQEFSELEQAMRTICTAIPVVGCLSSCAEENLALENRIKPTAVVLALLRGKSQTVPLHLPNLALAKLCDLAFHALVECNGRNYITTSHFTDNQWVSIVINGGGEVDFLPVSEWDASTIQKLFSCLALDVFNRFCDSIGCCHLRSGEVSSMLYGSHPCVVNGRIGFVKHTTCSMDNLDNPAAVAGSKLLDNEEFYSQGLLLQVVLYIVGFVELNRALFFRNFCSEATDFRLLYDDSLNAFQRKKGDKGWSTGFTVRNSRELLWKDNLGMPPAIEGRTFEFISAISRKKNLLEEKLRECAALSEDQIADVIGRTRVLVELFEDEGRKLPDDHKWTETYRSFFGFGQPHNNLAGKKFGPSGVSEEFTNKNFLPLFLSGQATF